MAIAFNADEVYDIAEEIERSGLKFYRACVQRVADAGAKKVLQDLAEMETQHLKTFQELHARLDAKAKEEMTFDPDGEGGAYLKATADSHIFKAYVDPSGLLKNESDPREIFELALRFEKDSVVFFLGASDMVPERLGKDDVMKLAKQEQQHIVVIQRALSQL